ncbi:hypothetical protein Tco_0434345 [Tanacetum coccineum]
MLGCGRVPLCVVEIIGALCRDYLCGYYHPSRVCPIVNAPAGRLLGAYDLGVATPRALVHAGDKTSRDARSWYMISGDAKSWVCDCFAYVYCHIAQLCVLIKENGLYLRLNMCTLGGLGFKTEIGIQIQVIMEYLVNISKRRAFWSINDDILKINVMTTNTPYPSRKIQRICAYTHQRPQRKQDLYAVSRRPIRRIGDIEGEYSERYQTWSLLQETPIRRIQYIGYAVSTPTLDPINTNSKTSFKCAKSYSRYLNHKS